MHPHCARPRPWPSLVLSTNLSSQVRIMVKCTCGSAYLRQSISTKSLVAIRPVFVAHGPLSGWAVGSPRSVWVLAKAHAPLRDCHTAAAVGVSASRLSINGCECVWWMVPQVLRCCLPHAPSSMRRPGLYSSPTDLCRVVPWGLPRSALGWSFFFAGLIHKVCNISSVAAS